MSAWRKVFRLKVAKSDARSYFDEEFYLSMYRDVERDGSLSALSHFNTYGWLEGRDPSPNFSTTFYISKNLNGQKENPLSHFVSRGSKLGFETKPKTMEEFRNYQIRLMRKYFDIDFYISQRPDFSGDPVESYFENPWVADPTPHFSTQDYTRLHSFLLESDLNPFFHFLALQGLPIPATNEQDPLECDPVRATEIVAKRFDAQYYLNVNLDVKEAGIDPLHHFMNYGWLEARNPHPLFWMGYYSRSNPDVAEAGQNPYYHFLRWGEGEGRRPNPIGDRLWDEDCEPSELKWEQLPDRPSDTPDVTIIMPVYKGYKETLRAIYAALSSKQKITFQLVVINDCSPEGELTTELERIALLDKFIYIYNYENKGFVATVNIGLRSIGLEDVVLLNSDAFVFNDWLDRLRSHVRGNVATVTPFSNNATTFSYPDASRNNLIALEVTSSELDRLAAIANPGSNSETPTGVGFCMYISNAALKEVGLLDEESFGKGYGEENDFCMRARQHGLVNLHAHDVFVYHKGQLSFGSYDPARMDAAELAVLGKHPNYATAIRRYALADLAKYARRRLDAIRLAELFRGSVVIYYHRTGGGLELHVKDLIDALRAEKLKVICLVADPVVPTLCTIVTAQMQALYRPNFDKIDLKEELAYDFINWLDPSLIHVHSFGRASASNINAVGKLFKATGCPVYFTVHDFGSICLRNNFVRADGVFCENSGGSPCRDCECGAESRVSSGELARRHRAFQDFFDCATLIAPSNFAAQRMEAAFKVAPLVLPHRNLLPQIEFVSQPPNNRTVRRIAVIGAIGVHKGSDVLHAAAVDAQKRKLALEFVIVGYSDISELLEGAGVRQTGLYRGEAEAMERLRAEAPDAVFFPSICPETFSYTLDIALSLGIPPIGFGLGAISERLRPLDWAFVLPLELIKAPSELNNVLLSLPLSDAWSKRVPATSVMYQNILTNYYKL